MRELRREPQLGAPGWQGALRVAPLVVTCQLQVRWSSAAHQFWTYAARIRNHDTGVAIMPTVLEPVRTPAAECGVSLLPRTRKRSERASARKKAFRRTLSRAEGL